jgi:Holliday junction DNA helicase RuvA
LARAILGNFQVEHLLKIILGGDTVSLSSVKGVGKKCAERIILELREKVAVADLTVLEEIKNSMENTEPYSLKKEVRDATDALIMLGYTRNMAEKATNEAAAEGAETIENIIKLALKKFQRGV